jgi:hypothetical protein
MKKFFDRLSAQPYHRALYRLCKEYDPDLAIDIGTDAGYSALALSLTGTRVITIGMSHRRYEKTLEKYRSFLAQYPLGSITKMTSDFKTLAPEDMVNRTFVFYDIHDHEHGDEQASSECLLQFWLPEFKDALVAVHDIARITEDWERPAHWKKPPSFSKARFWDGRWFMGFGECAVILQWLSKFKAQLHEVEGTKSLVYFHIKDGKPL